jgi:hypothetical protein
MMYYDYNKRSYLLPAGCKDLIDLLRLEEQKRQSSNQLPFLQSGDMFTAGTEDILAPWKLKKKKEKEPKAGPIGSEASTHEVLIPDSIVVMELANIAGQKPFKIIADLMEIGIFANLKQRVAFEAASQVLKKYGITAKKAL